MSKKTYSAPIGMCFFLISQSIFSFRTKWFKSAKFFFILAQLICIEKRKRVRVKRKKRLIENWIESWISIPHSFIHSFISCWRKKKLSPPPTTTNRMTILTENDKKKFNSKFFSIHSFIYLYCLSHFISLWCKHFFHIIWRGRKKNFISFHSLYSHKCKGDW